MQADFTCAVGPSVIMPSSMSGYMSFCPHHSVPVSWCRGELFAFHTIELASTPTVDGTPGRLFRPVRQWPLPIPNKRFSQSPFVCKNIVGDEWKNKKQIRYTILLYFIIHTHTSCVVVGVLKSIKHWHIPFHNFLFPLQQLSQYAYSLPPRKNLANNTVIYRELKAVPTCAFSLDSLATSHER